MKKFMSFRSLVLAMLFALGGNIQAGHDYSDNDDCCEEMTDCCDTAVNCGHWNVKVKVGINPKFFADRERSSVAVQRGDADTASALVPGNELPKFEHMFKNPGWLVGGELGYAHSDCMESFLEVAFTQNQGRNKDNSTVAEDFANLLLATDVNIQSAAGTTPARNGTFRLFNTDKYQSIAGYFGGRHYWGPWCNGRVSVYFGAKLGVLHRNYVETGLVGVYTNPAATRTQIRDPKTLLFLKNTVVSGGAQVGLNVCIWDRMSFKVAAEVVASGPWKNNTLYTLRQTEESFAPARAIVVGQTGTEISVPVTVGLGWEF